MASAWLSSMAWIRSCWSRLSRYAGFIASGSRLAVVCDLVLLLCFCRRYCNGLEVETSPYTSIVNWLPLYCMFLSTVLLQHTVQCSQGGCKHEQASRYLLSSRLGHDVAVPSAHCLLYCCAACRRCYAVNGRMILLLTAMLTSSYDIWTSLIASFLCDCTAAFGLSPCPSRTSWLMLQSQQSNSLSSNFEGLC